MVKTLKQIGIFVLLIIVGYTILNISNKRIGFLKDDEIVVNQEVYDSLIAIANRPPVIIIDTIRDTIYIHDTVYEVDTIEIEKTDQDTILVTNDTLITDYFKIFITDTINLSTDQVYRTWPYEVYTKEVIKYIEKEKPVIIKEYIDNSGLYYNLNIGYFPGVGMFNSGVTYMTKSDFGIGGSIGFVYVNMDNNIGGQIQPYVKPIIGINLIKKF